MTVSAGTWPDSALDAVDSAFAMLTCDPHPLTFDLDTCETAPDRPHGTMSLPALRSWLLRHPQAYPARNAIWRELIRRARLDGPSWVIVATAMALPALRRYAGQLSAGWKTDTRDLDSEILTGFLAALRNTVDAAGSAPYAKLCAAAWRAGFNLRQDDGRQPIPVGDVHALLGTRAPNRPYRHPDLLIHRAAQLGIIDEQDQQPYTDVRLGGRAIEPIAQRLGLGAQALRRRLERIDARLLEALHDGLLSDVISAAAARDLAAMARHRRRTRAAIGARSYRPTDHVSL